MHRKTIGALVFATALAVAGAASAATESGKISKIDPGAKTFTLQEGSKARDFSLGTDGKVMNGPKAITLNDLKVGEHVKVEYTESGGKLTASRVVVSQAKKAAAHAKKSSY